jgi:hypothetical protein
MTDNGRTAWVSRGSCGSHCGVARGGTATIRAKTVENGTITHPRLCRLCFGSIRWFPAFWRLALVVLVFFFVLVFEAFVAFVVVFVFFFLVNWTSPTRRSSVNGKQETKVSWRRIISCFAIERELIPNHSRKNWNG